MNKSLSTDKRLLEAIDLIDDKYIDEVADGYEVLHTPGEYTPNKKKVYKAYIKFALRAACAMLIVGLLISAPAIFTNIQNMIAPGTNVIDTEPEKVLEQMLTEEDLARLNEFFAMPAYPDYVWANTIEEAMSKPDFFGKYGDYIVVLKPTSLSALNSWKIGNYSFHANTAGYVVLHGDNTYGLLEAYLNGLITDEQVKNIRSYHMFDRSWVDQFYVDKGSYISQTTVPVELNSQEINNIMTAYFKAKLADSSSYQNNHLYNIRCFGSFDGVYAVMIDEFDRDNNINYINGKAYSKFIGDVEFKFRYTDNLYIYKDGVIELDLSDAFEKGMISESQLKALAEYFNENISLYPPKAQADSIDTAESFETNRIEVTIMPYADISRYTTKDFSEIGCSDIDIIEASNDSFTSRKLILTVASADKASIINAVKKLRMRSDIFSANPVYLNVIKESEFINSYINTDYHYYGKYGIGYARYSKSIVSVSKTETVDGYTFEYDNGTGIEIYYIDKFYTLLDAFEMNCISKSDLSLIYNYHTKAKHLNVKNKSDYPYELMDYEAKLIACLYNDIINDPLAETDYVVDCIFNHDGTYAAFISYDGQKFEDVTWSEFAVDIQFQYQNSQRLYIIKNGEVMSITDAASRYDISEVQWYAIHSMFENYQVN